LNVNFIRYLKENSSIFKELTSDFKIFLYKQNGATIGKNVRIGEGSFIIANEINIGEGTTIGDNTTINCDKIKLGKLNHIGSNVNISCRELISGDLLFSVSNFEIGGGGEKGPDSKVVLGNRCLICGGVLLNPSEHINIGNDVCISPRTMIYTHSHWQPILEGYNVTYGPVEIEDGVWIGPNCFVFPNIKIGKGSTIIANSLVATNVPSFSMFGGVPGKVIIDGSKYPRKLSPKRKDKIIRGILDRLIIILDDKGFKLYNKEIDGNIMIRINDKLVIYKFDINKEICEKLDGTQHKDVILIGFSFHKELLGMNFIIFNLNSMHIHGEQNEISDEIREFFRKNAIKFEPLLWRYGDKND